jgi:hypothetical protein
MICPLLDTGVVSFSVRGIIGLRIAGKTKVRSGGGPICKLDKLAQVEIPAIVTKTG